MQQYLEEEGILPLVLLLMLVTGTGTAIVFARRNSHTGGPLCRRTFKPLPDDPPIGLQKKRPGAEPTEISQARPTGNSRGASTVSDASAETSSTISFGSALEVPMRVSRCPINSSHSLRQQIAYKFDDSKQFGRAMM